MKYIEDIIFRVRFYRKYNIDHRTLRTICQLIRIIYYFYCNIVPIDISSTTQVIALLFPQSRDCQYILSAVMS